MAGVCTNIIGETDACEAAPSRGRNVLLLSRILGGRRKGCPPWSSSQRRPAVRHRAIHPFAARRAKLRAAMLIVGLILGLSTFVPTVANAAGVPSATTDPATAVTSSGATLNGKVTSNGNDTAAHFEYVANADYALGTSNPYSAGKTTPDAPVPANTPADQPTSASITGLQPNTVYHYRLVASNSAGTAQAGDQTVQTSGSGPPPQAVSFAPVVNYPVASVPVSIAHGDFNGDSKQDLVTASSTGVVSVSLGTGDGTFKTPITTRLPQGDGPGSLAAGDLNGDGKLDVAVQNGNNVSVLLGKGDGTFATPVDYAPAKVPGFNGDTPYLSSIALADVNGDGRPDILLTEGETPCCNAVGAEVMINHGDGTFGTPDRYGTGNTYNVATGVTAADVNGDGHPDLIVANSNCCFNTAHIAVFLGKGDGTFQTPPTDYAVRSGAASVRAGDFNGDGKADLAVFSKGASYYDGTEPAVSMLLNKGDGTFQAPLVYRTETPNSSAQPGAGPQYLTLADLNGDGSLDAITTNNDKEDGATAAVLVNNGNGTFQQHQEVATDGGPAAVTAEDFNGDGKPDIATANRGSGSDISVLLNTTPFPAPAGGGSGGGGGVPVPDTGGGSGGSGIRRGADCFDEVDASRPNPLNSEPAGDYCRKAAASRGYHATWDRNADAVTAGEKAGGDAVFYFAGHTAGCGDLGGDDARQVGAGLYFVRNRQGSVLRGQKDSACLAHTAPSCFYFLCVPGSGIPAVFSAPQDLNGASFVVLQGCLTMHDTRRDESIGNQIFDGGARTVIGFDKDIQFQGAYGQFGSDFGKRGPYRPYGDAWAAGFWQAFGEGKSVIEAVDAASAYEYALTGDPTDGYRQKNIIIRQHPGAPTRLDARSVPAARLANSRGGVTARAASRSEAARHRKHPTRSARLSRALTRFLRRRLPRGLRWTAQPGPRGTNYAANVPGVGLFVVDSLTYSVNEAVFDPPRKGGRSVSHGRAKRLAVGFAARHAGSLSGLVLRRDETSGSGHSGEIEFLWQARRRGAWLPTYVDVNVRGDGSIASYVRDSAPVKVQLVPRISRSTAARIALRITHTVRGTTSLVRQLTVRNLRRGAQKLIWDVWVRPGRGHVLAPDTVVWVDARTGRPV